MTLQDKNFREIYRTWKSKLGIFEPFMRSGPFVSLQTYEDFKITYQVNEEKLYENHKDKLFNITEYNLEKNFIIIDIKMKEALEIAYLLNNCFNIKPIINFNFLFHPYGLVGNNSSIERLVVYGENLKKIIPEGYVLFLDFERYGEFSKELYKKKLNNQYEISEEDLPSGELLRDIGYCNLTIFTENELKEDVKAYVDSVSSYLSVEIKKWG